MNIMESQRNFISRPEIQFWMPILATIISITVWGMSLKGDIALLSRDLDNHIKIAQQTTDTANTAIMDLRTTQDDVLKIKTILKMQ